MVREGSARDIAPTVDPVPGENRRYATGTATDSSVFHTVPVCAGLGRRFGIAPWPARILFLLLLIVIPGSQILIYPFLGLAGLAIAQGSASLASADAVEQGRCMKSVVRRLCASMAQRSGDVP